MLLDEQRTVHEDPLVTLFGVETLLLLDMDSDYSAYRTYSRKTGSNLEICQYRHNGVDAEGSSE